MVSGRGVDAGGFHFPFGEKSDESLGEANVFKFASNKHQL